jgi:hypothetical protein
LIQQHTVAAILRAYNVMGLSCVFLSFYVDVGRAHCGIIYKYYISDVVGRIVV